MGIRRRAIGLLIGLGACGVPSMAVWAQPPPFVLRIALLPQWTLNQHRTGREASPALRDALEGGVVDRTVFAWQRGLIPRSALVAKPIRVVSDEEASALGGHGQFEVTALRAPAGRTAWTEVEIASRSGQPEDVLVLEVGGERNTVVQVLETLLVQTPDGRLVAQPLARPALVPGVGVPIVGAPFGQSVAIPSAGTAFRDVGGLEMLVVRSLVEVVRNGDRTPNGPADMALPGQGDGDWREGDRVFLRVTGRPPGRLPGVVLGWKDRTLQSDPDVLELPRRSALPLPIVR
jgi:hypothetical protein